jgi:hypothetical protein
MQSIPSLPSKFITNNTSYKEVDFKDLQVGSYYFMHTIVIEFHSMYDHLLQVISKSAEGVVAKKVYSRYHDNCRYPGDWEEEESLETITGKEDSVIVFYIQ